MEICGPDFRWDVCTPVLFLDCYKQVFKGLVITDPTEFWPGYQTQNSPNDCFCQSVCIMVLHVTLHFSS